MTAKTTAKSNFLIPNDGGFSPSGAGVLELVVIRSASPQGQSPAIVLLFSGSVICECLRANFRGVPVVRQDSIGLRAIDLPRELQPASR
jgi:hypothetical protein